MLEKFANWYNDYYSEITWWIIGWLSWGLLDAVARGSWIIAIVDAALIAINYQLWKTRN